MSPNTKQGRRMEKQNKQTKHTHTKRKQNKTKTCNYKVHR